MFREPTKDGLKAQAGWAGFSRTYAAPEHAVALDKYRDGCEALIPYANTGTADPESVGEVKLPAQTDLPSRFEQRIVAHPLLVAADGCAHRFNIHDQHCLYCGVSKRQALASRGRRAELSVP